MLLAVIDAAVTLLGYGHGCFRNLEAAGRIGDLVVLEGSPHALGVQAIASVVDHVTGDGIGPYVFASRYTVGIDSLVTHALKTRPLQNLGLLFLHRLRVQSVGRDGTSNGGVLSVKDLGQARHGGNCNRSARDVEHGLGGRIHVVAVVRRHAHGHGTIGDVPEEGTTIRAYLPLDLCVIPEALVLIACCLCVLHGYGRSVLAPGREFPPNLMLLTVVDAREARELKAHRAAVDHEVAAHKDQVVVALIGIARRHEHAMVYARVFTRRIVLVGTLHGIADERGRILACHHARNAGREGLGVVKAKYLLVARGANGHLAAIHRQGQVAVLANQGGVIVGVARGDTHLIGAYVLEARLLVQRLPVLFSRFAPCVAEASSLFDFQLASEQDMTGTVVGLGHAGGIEAQT